MVLLAPDLRVGSPHLHPLRGILCDRRVVRHVGLVGSLILQVIGSGAVPGAGKPGRPAQLLTFSGFFHTVRIMGGQIGTVLILDLLSERTKFHANILSQETGLARLPVSGFLHSSASALSSATANPSQTAGWTGYLLGSMVRQQASTLAFADAFTLIAWATIAVLIGIAFLRLSISSFKELIDTFTNHIHRAKRFVRDVFARAGYLRHGAARSCEARIWRRPSIWLSRTLRRCSSVHTKWRK
jgi:hypothetical protein